MLNVSDVPKRIRKTGRPKETWRRTAEKELKEVGLGSWAEASVFRRDRDG